MTTEDLLSYINLVDKAIARFERTDSSLERSSMGKMFSNSIAYNREIIHERKSGSSSKFRCCLNVRSCHNYPKLQQPLP